MALRYGMAKVLITGGFGYVGSRLTPHLLEQGHHVRVLDAMIFTSLGLDALKSCPSFSQWESRFEFIQDDIRNPSAVQKAMEGIESVIHLAAISNDPTGEIDEVLTRQINFDAVGLLLYYARKNNVQRFINTSTNSVMGVKDEEMVTENLEPEPLTLYAKYKALAEWLVFTAASPNFCTVNIRPATICGYSPRQRFDLTANRLTADAVRKHRLNVHIGGQVRPFVGMSDVINIYTILLQADSSLISGKTFHFGFENHKIADLAKMIQDAFSDQQIDISEMENSDFRKFRISSERIQKTLNYQPVGSVKDEILNLRKILDEGQFPDIDAPEFYNIRSMKISRMPSSYQVLSNGD